MSLTLTFVQEVDPEPLIEDSGDYLDITAVMAEGGGQDCMCKVEYSRPLHLSTVVGVAGAANNQAVIPLDAVGELDEGRKVLVNGVEHNVVSVDDINNTITISADLVVALIGGEAAITTDATVQKEIEEDLTERGYNF